MEIKKKKIKKLLSKFNVIKYVAGDLKFWKNGIFSFFSLRFVFLLYCVQYFEYYCTIVMLKRRHDLPHICVSLWYVNEYASYYKNVIKCICWHSKIKKSVYIYAFHSCDVVTNKLKETYKWASIKIIDSDKYSTLLKSYKASKEIGR